MKKISAVIGIVVSLGIIFSGAFYLEDRYARASELRQLQSIYARDRKEDRMEALQERMWALEERKDEGKFSVTDKEHYREYKMEFDKLERELKK